MYAQNLSTETNLPKKHETRGRASLREVSTSTTAFIGTLNGGPLLLSVPVASYADFVLAFGGAAVEGCELADQLRQYFANGGEKAYVVRAPGLDLFGLRAALAALDKVRSFNLLSIPELPSRGLRTALRYAASRQAFFLIDAPAALESPAEVNEWLAAQRLTKDERIVGAVFFPRVRVIDTLKPGSLKTIAPSGTVAGVYARTDRAKGVGFTGAGIIDGAMRGVHGFSYDVLPMEHLEMLEGGANSLRALPGFGPCISGSRTLERDHIELRFVAPARQALLDFAETRG